MTGPVASRGEMLAGMAPVLLPDVFRFCTTADPALAARAVPVAIATFREDEGQSLILSDPDAGSLGFPEGAVMRCITLTVLSSLEGVGLTAAVAGALAEAGIACNMVAAFHHDHVLVPADRADAAMAALLALQASARPTA